MNLEALFDPMASAQAEDPYSVYARARREAPVFHSTVLDAWVVTRYEDVCAILKDPVRFSSQDVIKRTVEPPQRVRAILSEGIPYVRTLLDNDPPGHSRFRCLVNKAFSPRRVAELEPQIRAVANELVDGFFPAGRVDIMERFAGPLPGLAILSILGLPREDLADLKRWCDDWMALQSGTSPENELVECARNYLALQRYFQAKVDERTNSSSDDLLTALIQARIEGQSPLTRDELVRLLMSLLVAGHETTTHFIGNTLVLLLTNGKAAAALRADPALASQVVEEGLRLDTPVQCLFRRASEDVELGGRRISKGSRILVMYGSANRDKSQFDDPDSFHIERATANLHLSFSRGRHFCLGAPMARMEGRVALEVLMQRLPHLRLDDNLIPERIHHFFLRGYKQLFLQWDSDVDG